MLSSNAQKKRQEEKNSKSIRELASIPTNRNCFECGQRGPTYVNVTEGSFCCTTCSGILRGLNPPHRVKSISMATFTTEDVELLTNKGNAENQRTWMGLYGGEPTGLDLRNKEDITKHITTKYEKKQWYVSPSELQEQEKLLSRAREIASQSAGSDASTTSKVSSRPNEVDLFSSDPFARSPNLSSTRSNMSAPMDLFSSPSAYSSSSQAFSPPNFAAPPPPTTRGPPAHQLPPKKIDNSPFSSSPFGSVPVSTAMQPQPSSGDNIFADFDAKFKDMSLKSSSTVSAFGSSLGAPNQNMPKSATDSAFHLQSNIPPTYNFPGQVKVLPDAFAPLQPTGPTVPQPLPPVASRSIDSARNEQQQQPVPTPRTQPTAAGGGDKYSALAELDQLFHSGGTSTNTVNGESKPAWMPSGFSTGIPPSHHTPAFPDIPQPKVNGYGGGGGSIPKSNTFGGEFAMTVGNGVGGGIAANPFAPALPTQQPHANSQLNLSMSTNPFATQMPPGYVTHFANPYQQQYHPSMMNPPQGAHPGYNTAQQNMIMNNPFGTGMMQQVPAFPTQQPLQNGAFGAQQPANQNYNPFL